MKMLEITHGYGIRRFDDRGFKVRRVYSEREPLENIQWSEVAAVHNGDDRCPLECGVRQTPGLAWQRVAPALVGWSSMRMYARHGGHRGRYAAQDENVRQRRDGGQT